MRIQPNMNCSCLQSPSLCCWRWADASNLRFGTNHTDAGLFERTGGFWCETGALSVLAQEQTLLISGKLRYCFLGTDADGVPVYFEQAQDVAQEYQLETKADGYLPEWSITVEDCQYAIQEKTTCNAVAGCG